MVVLGRDVNILPDLIKQPGGICILKEIINIFLKKGIFDKCFSISEIV